jgi:hypothetical protein
MLVEDSVCREINAFFFFRFKYRMFYVLYPFVTYLLTLLNIFFQNFRLNVCIHFYLSVLAIYHAHLIFFEIGHPNNC